MALQDETRARSGAPSSLTGFGVAVREAIRDGVPDALLTRRLFVRALGVWIGVRLAIQALGTLPAGVITLIPMRIGAAGVVVMMVVVGALGLVDNVRRNERLLLANLGIRRRIVVLIGAAAALAGEWIVSLPGAI